MFWIHYQQHTFLVDSERGGNPTYYWVLIASFNDVTGVYLFEIVPADDSEVRLQVQGTVLDRAAVEQTILTYESTLPPLPPEP